MDIAYKLAEDSESVLILREGRGRRNRLLYKFSDGKSLPYWEIIEVLKNGVEVRLAVSEEGGRADRFRSWLEEIMGRDFQIYEEVFIEDEGRELG